MRRSTLRSWLVTALVLGWLFVPITAQAHEGQGFHPEALWAVLRTGFLVAAVMVALAVGLWAFERVKLHREK